MALTITQLNGDASFLLALEPLGSAPTSKPFYIVLDPWITGPSTILHSKISITTHKDRACISSLLELPDEPDLVIISQNRADHLNPATLRQLPPSGTKTTILAEPGSARTIRSWKYFDDGKVVTIPKWDNRGGPAVIRIPVPNGDVSGKPGEITVAFIPQRHDILGLHSAVAITYRPPPVIRPRGRGTILTPPATPGSSPQLVQPATGYLMSPTPTRSLSTRRYSCHSITSLPALDRPLSVIFSPHGIRYSSLHNYVTRHLVLEAALPLTALLHCFDSVSSRWLGNILSGAPPGEYLIVEGFFPFCPFCSCPGNHEKITPPQTLGISQNGQYSLIPTIGVEIAAKLGARAWFSTHDGGNTITGGVVTNFLKTTRFRREDILQQLGSTEPSVASSTTLSKSSSGARPKTTELFALAIGETITVSSEVVLDPTAENVLPRVHERRTRHQRGESWLDLDEEDSDSTKPPSVELPRGMSSN